MRYLIVTICCLLLFYPVYHNETLKYHHALHDCWESYSANRDLLLTDICTNPLDRLRYKDAGTVHCDLAERETRLTPRQCAFQKWWFQTEFVRMYYRMAGSYWSVVGVLMPVTCFISYLYYKRSMHMWSENNFYDKQERYIQRIMPEYTIPVIELE